MNTRTLALRHLARSCVVALASCALLLGSAPAAKASPETLKRAFANIIQGPLDILLSPIVAGKTLVTNLQDIEDTTAVRVAYTVPGYIWLVGMEVGGGLLRFVSGGLELLPGIFLLPFDTDIDELFDPASRAEAMFDFENPLNEEPEWLQYMVPIYPFIVNYRFGLSYTSTGGL